MARHLPLLNAYVLVWFRREATCLPPPFFASQASLYGSGMGFDAYCIGSASKSIPEPHEEGLKLFFCLFVCLHGDPPENPFQALIQACRLVSQKGRGS